MSSARRPISRLTREDPAMESTYFLSGHHCLGLSAVREDVFAGLLVRQETAGE